VFLGESRYGTGEARRRHQDVDVQPFLPLREFDVLAKVSRQLDQCNVNTLSPSHLTAGRRTGQREL
jgi:hypothetical protein